MTAPPAAAWVPRRIDMTAATGAATHAALPGERPVAACDLSALAALYRCAYEGSPDDGRETPEQALAEMQDTLAGAYGPFIGAASRVVARDGIVVAAVLVTRWCDRPLVAYCMTHPRWRRRGLARAGMLNALADTRAAGEPLLSLVVTVRNRPAMALYEQLGFKPGR